MTLLRNTSLAMILSTSLVMGGCSNKDKGPSAEKSAPAQTLGLKAPSDKAFAKHFDVPSRKVSEAEGKQALGELNLLDKNDEGLSWAKSSGKNGNYSYTNLTANDGAGNGQLTIGKAELVGVHMDGDIATFDRADFSDIKIYDQTEDVTIKMGTLSVVRPTPDMAEAIITSLQNIRDLDDLDLGRKNNDKSFGALGMSNINIVSKELNITTDSLMWGEDAETNLTDFKIENVNLNVDENQSETPLKVTLKSLSATGLNGDLFDNAAINGRSPLNIMGGFNPLRKMYDTVKMEDLNIDSEAVSVTSKGFEGRSTEKGGVTTQQSVGEPFIIRLKEAPKDPQMQQAYQMVKNLGFDELVFQSSQTTIMDANKDTIAVKDGLLYMKDGFKLSYNYGASGVKAMSTTVQAMEGADARDSQGSLKAVMDDVKLNGFQLRLEDKSIVERGLKLAAQIRGGTPEKVKKELKVALSLAPLMAGGLEGEMIGEIGGAFGDFIEDGGTLSIVMNPNAPISMTELADYKRSQLSKADLGFSAKAE